VRRGASHLPSERFLPARLFPAPALLLVLALLASGCASTPEGPPRPGEARGGIPSLRGRTVMVLPVQRTVVPREAADRELAFALSTRGEATEWVGPDELRRIMGASPAMEYPIERLPVEMFWTAEVDRVGDPIYGVLRRMAALSDAELALIPLRISVPAPAPDSANVATEPEGPRVELLATIIDIRTGLVLWTGAVDARGEPAAPATLAGVMESLARTLLPFAVPQARPVAVRPSERLTR
jgi:hypothetical protein